MDNSILLEAPPAMFDELEAILKQSEGNVALRSKDSVTRGIRRMDTASYSVTLDGAAVEVWAERRVGNPTMSVSVGPMQESILRPDAPSVKLSRQIVDMLVVHGARYE